MLSLRAFVACKKGETYLPTEHTKKKHNNTRRDIMDGFSKKKIQFPFVCLQNRCFMPLCVMSLCHWPLRTESSENLLECSVYNFRTQSYLPLLLLLTLLLIIIIVIIMECIIIIYNSNKLSFRKALQANPEIKE
jgi:hypothetical protein